MKKYLFILAILLVSLTQVNKVSAHESVAGTKMEHPRPEHCKDKDGDGFYVQPKFCGIRDCDDNNPNVRPLTDGALIDSNFISCGNNVELTSPIQVTDNGTLDCKEGTLTDSEGILYGVEILGSNVTVKNCKLNGFRMGIYDNGESTNNTYENNSFENIEHTAIYLNGNTYSQVKNNAISSSRNGVYLRYSDMNLVEGNFISNAESYGIYTYYANYNNLLANEISDSGWNEGYTYRSGISLGYVNEGNYIAENILRYNDLYNIQLRGRVPDEIPTSNIIINNYIYGTSINDIEVSNNTYCVDNQENLYFDGATGPTCQL